MVEKRYPDPIVSGSLTQDFWRQARRIYCDRREHGLMPCDQVSNKSNAAWRQKDASGGL